MVPKEIVLLSLLQSSILSFVSIFSLSLPLDSVFSILSIWCSLLDDSVWANGETRKGLHHYFAIAFESVVFAFFAVSSSYRPLIPYSDLRRGPLFNMTRLGSIPLRNQLTTHFFRKVKLSLCFDPWIVLSISVCQFTFVKRLSSCRGLQY